MPSKLMSDVYESGHQGCYTTWGDQEGFLRLLGRLRLDCILFERVVFNDQSILDGVFVLDAARRGRLSELPWSRIDVTGRADTFDECFHWTFARHNRETLVPFWLSSLVNDELSASVSKEVEQLSAVHARSPESLCRALSSVGVSSEIVERQNEAWTNLRQYLSENDIRISKWRNAFPFEQHISSASKEVHSVLRTLRGLEVFQKVWSDRGSRNLVRGHLNQGYGLIGGIRHASHDEQRDIATVDTWYESAYQSSIAEQHGCDSLELGIHSDAWDYSEKLLPIARLINEQNADDCLSLPTKFLCDLGRVPADTFKTWLKPSYSVTSGVNAWREMRAFRPESARGYLKESIVDLVDDVRKAVGRTRPSDWPKIVGGCAAGATAGAAAHKACNYIEKNLDVSMSKRGFLFAGLCFGTWAATEVPATIVAEETLDPQQRLAEAVVQIAETRLSPVIT